MKAEDLGHITTHEFINLFLGEKLGEGSYREVYALRTDDTKVIKIERYARSFSNVHEWEVWKNTYPESWKRWLAPCHYISDSGTVLIQSRVTPVTKLPEKLPSFLTDIKLSNWGKLNGRVVCCDYGNHKFFSDGFWKAKLVKAKPFA